MCVCVCVCVYACVSKYMYLPNPYAPAGSDIISISSAEVNVFEFKVFLPNRLPYQRLIV